MPVPAHRAPGAGRRRHARSRCVTRLPACWCRRAHRTTGQALMGVAPTALAGRPRPGRRPQPVVPGPHDRQAVEEPDERVHHDDQALRLDVAAAAPPGATRPRSTAAGSPVVILTPPASMSSSAMRPYRPSTSTGRRRRSSSAPLPVPRSPARCPGARPHRTAGRPARPRRTGRPHPELEEATVLPGRSGGRRSGPPWGIENTGGAASPAVALHSSSVDSRARKRSNRATSWSNSADLAAPGARGGETDGRAPVSDHRHTRYSERRIPDEMEFRILLNFHQH